MGKEEVRVCTVCRVAEIDDNLVSAGEYDYNSIDPSHGSLSNRCFKFLRGFDLEGVKYEECPASEDMGRILYVPKGKVFLPENYFKMVASGYEVLTLGEDASSDLVEELASKKDYDLMILHDGIDCFFEGDSRVILNYEHSNGLLSKIHSGLEASRQRHYESTL